MISEELLMLLLSGLGVAIGYLVKELIDRRKEAEAARAADRREHYRNVIVCLKSINEGNMQSHDLLRYEYSFLFLYAPDTVIRSFNALLSEIRSEGNREQVSSKVGDLVLEMRRDLGFRRSRLESTDFQLM